jgi:hypothetical protein
MPAQMGRSWLKRTDYKAIRHLWNAARPSRSTERGQDVADSPTARGFGQGQVFLHPIPVAPPVLFLDHVPGLREIVDEIKGPPFCDSQARGEVAQAHIRVIGEAQQDPPVIGKKTQCGHT